MRPGDFLPGVCFLLKPVLLACCRDSGRAAPTVTLTRAQTHSARWRWFLQSAGPPPGWAQKPTADLTTPQLMASLTALHCISSEILQLKIIQTSRKGERIAVRELSPLFKFCQQQCPLLVFPRVRPSCHPSARPCILLISRIRFRMSSRHSPPFASKHASKRVII